MTEKELRRLSRTDLLERSAAPAAGAGGDEAEAGRPETDGKGSRIYRGSSTSDQ